MLLTFLNSTVTSFRCLLIVWKEQKNGFNTFKFHNCVIETEKAGITWNENWINNDLGMYIEFPKPALTKHTQWLVNYNWFWLQYIYILKIQERQHPNRRYFLTKSIISRLKGRMTSMFVSKLSKEQASKEAERGWSGFGCNDGGRRSPVFAIETKKKCGVPKGPGHSSLMSRRLFSRFCFPCKSRFSTHDSVVTFALTGGYGLSAGQKWAKLCGEI